MNRTTSCSVDRVERIARVTAVVVGMLVLSLTVIGPKSVWGPARRSAGSDGLVGVVSGHKGVAVGNASRLVDSRQNGSSTIGDP